LITNIYKPSIILTTGDNDELENLDGSAPYSRTAIKYFSGYILNNEIAELSKNTTNFFWPIKGNHDISQSSDFENIFRAIFSVSSNQLSRKTYYDLFAGPCHFIMLDTSNGSLSDEQKAWLKYRIGLSTSTWRIILTHYPVYASSDTNHDIVNPSEIYSEIDFNYVDVVISGHHHINEVIKKNNTYFINLGTSSFVRSFGANKLFSTDGVLYQDDANNSFISGRADCNSLELKLINKDNQILFTIIDNERNS
jgi:predicted phosphodiesterase